LCGACDWCWQTACAYATRLAWCDKFAAAYHGWGVAERQNDAPNMLVVHQILSIGVVVCSMC
jgi:hypothetical protein